jgi:hypothetical protein
MKIWHSVTGTSLALAMNAVDQRQKNDNATLFRRGENKST